MRVDYESEDYIRGCIRACERRKHLQQVVFSTFHDCLTQICFTCKVVNTSLPYTEQVKMKTNQSLKSFESSQDDYSPRATITEKSKVSKRNEDTPEATSNGNQKVPSSVKNQMKTSVSSQEHSSSSASGTSNSKDDYSPQKKALGRMTHSKETEDNLISKEICANCGRRFEEHYLDNPDGNVYCYTEINSLEDIKFKPKCEDKLEDE